MCPHKHVSSSSSPSVRLEHPQQNLGRSPPGWVPLGGATIPAANANANAAAGSRWIRTVGSFYWSLLVLPVISWFINEEIERETETSEAVDNHASFLPSFMLLPPSCRSLPQQGHALGGDAALAAGHPLQRQQPLLQEPHPWGGSWSRWELQRLHVSENQTRLHAESVPSSSEVPLPGLGCWGPAGGGQGSGRSHGRLAARLWLCC